MLVNHLKFLFADCQLFLHLMFILFQIRNSNNKDVCDFAFCMRNSDFFLINFAKKFPLSFVY